LGRKKIEIVQMEVEGGIVEAKECTKCGVTKPLTEYHKQKRCVGGRTPNCKFCIRKKQYESRYGSGVEVPEVSKQKTREIVSIEVNGQIKDAKECNKCLKVQPLTRFNNHRKGLGGKDQTCKKCVLERNREWKKDNLDKSREYGRNWARRKYETDIEYRRKVLERDKKRYQATKEIHAERWERYYRENKSWLREKRKEHYHQNKEVYATRWKRYYQSPRGQEVTSKIAHKRRSLEKESITSLTTAQWKSCKKHFNNACAYCGSEGKLTKDHFVPVSKGGDLVVTNVVPACVSCNSSKHAKDFFDWYPSYFRYNSARETKILKYLGIKEDGTQQLAMF
jgi:hypothetical protein